MVDLLFSNFFDACMEKATADGCISDLLNDGVHGVYTERGVSDGYLVDTVIDCYKKCSGDDIEVGTSCFVDIDGGIFNLFYFNSVADEGHFRRYFDFYVGLVEEEDHRYESASPVDYFIYGNSADFSWLFSYLPKYGDGLDWGTPKLLPSGVGSDLYSILGSVLFSEMFSDSRCVPGYIDSVYHLFRNTDCGYSIEVCSSAGTFGDIADLDRVVSRVGGIMESALDRSFNEVYLLVFSPKWGECDRYIFRNDGDVVVVY